MNTAHAQSHRYMIPGLLVKAEKCLRTFSRREATRRSKAAAVRSGWNHCSVAARLPSSRSTHVTATCNDYPDCNTNARDSAFAKVDWLLATQGRKQQLEGSL